VRLELNLYLAQEYHSPSQRARRMTEGWFAAEMYCPACPSPRLATTRDNTKVVDLLSRGCRAQITLDDRIAR
jgi:hypothetical protein